MGVISSLERRHAARKEWLDQGGTPWGGGSWGLLGQGVRGRAKLGKRSERQEPQIGFMAAGDQIVLLPGRAAVGGPRALRVFCASVVPIVFSQV